MKQLSVVRVSEDQIRKRELTPVGLASIIRWQSRERRVVLRIDTANRKQLVSVRYSPEVLAYFKGTGEGWKSRMDGVLREYVAKQSGRRARRAS